MVAPRGRIGYPKMLKFIATFVLGAACTALAGWMMVVKPIGNVFASTYLIAVMDQANIALHVRAGKPELLLHNIDPSLPTYVMAIQDHFRTHPESTNALWMVRAYYERSKLPMPTRPWPSRRACAG